MREVCPILLCRAGSDARSHPAFRRRPVPKVERVMSCALARRRSIGRSVGCPGRAVRGRGTALPGNARIQVLRGTTRLVKRTIRNTDTPTGTNANVNTAVTALDTVAASMLVPSPAMFATMPAAAVPIA